VTPREANVFLTKAALLDPRMKRLDEEEQADMATMWAETLADVELEAALEAMRAHYRAATVPVMPAHVLERLGVVEVASSPYRDITAEVVAASRARELLAAGVTEAEYQAHATDREWLLEKFGQRDAIEVADENGEPE